MPVQNQHNFLFETDLARSNDIVFVADGLQMPNPAVKPGFAMLFVSCVHGRFLVGVIRGAERRLHITDPRLPVK